MAKSILERKTTTNMTKQLCTLLLASLVSVVQVFATTQSGKFTVNQNGDYIIFSEGNLQYNAAKGVWRFAENQYDTIGVANANISATYNGWIDMFGWATSGWQDGIEAYMPYSADTDNGHYWLAGSYENDMVGNWQNADWGVYNAIGNEEAGTWRTLTEAEWGYIIGGRPDARQLKGTAQINGINGCLLLPDGIELPESITFAPSKKGWDTNVYDETTWKELEQMGCVFLPCTGMRSRNTGEIKDVNAMGGYWTATHKDEQSAYGVLFLDTIITRSNFRRSAGFAVRLAKDYISEEVTVAAVDTSSVAISWERVENAATYVLTVLDANGDTIGVYTFGQNGELQQQAAPAAPARQKMRSSDGLLFTIEGLRAGNKYSFRIVAKDMAEAIVAEYRGTLITPQATSVTALTDIQTNDSRMRKKVIDGRIYIVHPDGTIYNLQGAKVKGSF